MAGTNVLGLVFYSILLGLAIGNIGTKGKPLSDFFNSLTDVMMKIMKWITLYASLLYYYRIRDKFKIFTLLN